MSSILPNIPRLGQGVRGGAGALPNLPGSGNMGLPSLANIPHIGGVVAPRQGGGMPLPANLAAAAQPQVRPQILNAANNILSRVGSGHLDIGRAKTMIANIGLNAVEKHQLAKNLLTDSAMTNRSHQPELMALGQIPTGKDIGQTGSMDPTHALGVGGRIVANLGKDASSTVTGLMPGLYLTGKSIGQDVLAQAQGKAPTHTLRNVLEPMAKQYAHTYGPAVQGNFGETAHRLTEHPLQPLLDAAALASAGLGTGARVSEALTAARAGRVAELAGGAKGVAKVGDNLIIQEQKNGMFAVREGNVYHVHNLPTKDAAWAAAKQMQKYQANPLAAFLKGGGDRGRFIDRYNTRLEAKTGIHPHEEEITNMTKEIASVLQDPSIGTTKQTLKGAASQIAADLKGTYQFDKGKPNRFAEQFPGVVSGSGSKQVLGKAMSAATTTMREASDLVRETAVILRPAYLPNNWVGNSFMNLIHQGFLAPVNLAKSFAMDKQLGANYTAAIRKTLGTTPAEMITSGTSHGYVRGLTGPVTKFMGKWADQPARDAAWLHEARRAGYNNLGAVKGLVDKAAKGDEAATRQMAIIGQKAQEEVVKFGKMSDKEKDMVRHMFFIYSWMRGSARYAARFAGQHPIQSAAYSNIGQNVGIPYVNRELGGHPSFMSGVIPIGHKANGDPILINPMSLNPLGTAMDIGQAAVGTYKAISGDPTFNKFEDKTFLDLLNPIPAAVVKRIGGGKSVKTQLGQQMAAVNLAHQLQHPGSGSIYPTSKAEALGHFTLGSVFPRRGNAVAIQKALERQQQSNPVARIPTDMQTYKKLTGQDIPKELIEPYKQDLAEIAREKDFQRHYAGAHGQSGFRNLPPSNRLDAAIQYLSRGHASPSDIQSYKEAAAQLKTDSDISSFANALWSTTGAGQYKSVWDELMSQARGQRLTPKRQ